MSDSAHSGERTCIQYLNQSSRSLSVVSCATFNEKPILLRAKTVDLKGAVSMHNIDHVMVVDLDRDDASRAEVSVRPSPTLVSMSARCPLSSSFVPSKRVTSTDVNEE